MTETKKTGLGTRLMALGCRICPFCIAARMWPNSGHAKRMRSLEKSCPFCRAYDRLHSDVPDADNPE